MSDNTSPGGYDWRPAPDRAAEEAAARKAKIKRGAWALGVIAVVAFSMVWNPPTGSVHSFTKASDYKASTDSGCTNSGDGCHGKESSYTDFNEYHPNSKCTSCHDYQGVGCIPCHSPDGHECQSCHDGTMEIAVDRTRLTDPYPRGHYRETTHTAMGTDMTKIVFAAEDGKAQAACKACHSRDLFKAHTDVPEADGTEYGTTVGCGECHNDTRAHGLDQVKSNWEEQSCEVCHSSDSSAPMHDAQIADAVEGSGKAGCGSTGKGCHLGNDLHSLHADAPKDCSGSADTSESICHNLELQSHEPTVTACGTGSGGACHGNYVNDTYSHEKDKKAHSVSGFRLSGDRSYDSPCGDCHNMASNGMSLVAEHDRPTNVIAGSSPSTCDACHNANDITADVVKSGWDDKSGSGACSACHDDRTVSTRHSSAAVHDGRALTDEGTPNDSACQTDGCHDTLDLVVLHEDAGGCTTQGCHQNSGNIYGLNTISCGGSNTRLACHVGVHDEFGEMHIAGWMQASSMLHDVDSDTYIACLFCHEMNVITEHSRSNSALAGGTGTICVRCHEATDGTRSVVDDRWVARDTSGACSACHSVMGGVATKHTNISAVHKAVERSETGTPTPGFCSSSGCHPGNDVRIIHQYSTNICASSACHRSGTASIYGPKIMSCGGLGAATCHALQTAASHQDHSADLTGTVNSVTYTRGANVGCFGCHYSDLTVEHSMALKQGSMSGGGANVCRICHAGPVDAENGRYAYSNAVMGAIENGDRRCIACHMRDSGDDPGSSPLASKVAAPHSKIATDLVAQPNGAVWTDPFGDWRAALNATTGGGHNALSAAVVGAMQNKDFPTISYSTETTTYNWPLPSNTVSTTAWLRTAPASEGGIEGTETVGLPLKYFPDATTTSGIQSAMVECSDCHVMADMVGPQGASVKIAIDPAYSQTEYANPTPGTYQFDPFNLEGATSNNPAGYKPVICVKCHLVYARSRPDTATVRVGGASLHNTHRSRHDTYRADGTTNGPWEACVDCHVRIPHAWKRPRLLARTVQATMSPQAIEPDEPPYVKPGYTGLKGVILMSIGSTGVSGSSCSAGGCEGTHVHTASQPATQTYWP